MKKRTDEQKGVSAALGRAHGGQPLGKGKKQGQTDRKGSHADAVPEFTLGFLIGFVIHGSEPPMFCFSIGYYTGWEEKSALRNLPVPFRLR